jgi:hypothetical protein
MKKLRILIGLAVCCLWVGYGHDRSEATGKTVTEPANPVIVGATVTFNVVATTNGDGPLRYQWNSDGTNTSGATNR